MNQPLIDNSLLALAFFTAAFMVRANSRRRIGTIPAFLLLFAPLIIFFNMWAHTVAVGLVNYKRYVAGAFHYSFHFYALILFGIVFIVTSGFSIHFSKQFINGDGTRKTPLHTINAATALLFIPMILINPIALLPVLASLVSSATIAISSRNRQFRRTAKDEPVIAAVQA